MLYGLMILGGIYTLAWIASRGATPAQWEESQQWADRLGKRLLVLVFGFIGLLWLMSWLGPLS
jgi:hypothetical protein